MKNAGTDFKNCFIRRELINTFRNAPGKMISATF